MPPFDGNTHGRTGGNGVGSATVDIAPFPRRAARRAPGAGRHGRRRIRPSRRLDLAMPEPVPPGRDGRRPPIPRRGPSLVPGRGPAARRLFAGEHEHGAHTQDHPRGRKDPERDGKLALAATGARATTRHRAALGFRLVGGGLPIVDRRPAIATHPLVCGEELHRKALPADLAVSYLNHDSTP